MQQSRLVRYISDLDSREREQFCQFVSSPYFNQHDQTTKLMKLIVKNVDGKAEKLERERVFKQLFPKEDFNEQRLHNVMSYLMKLFHRFLAIRHFEEQPFQEQLYTLEAAYHHHQFDLFNNRLRQLEKDLKKSPIHDSQMHYISYRMQSLKGYYEATHHDRSNTKFFQSMMVELDKFYISEKLKYSAHLTANMMVMNTQYNLGFLDELLNFIKENWNEYNDSPSIAAFYNIIMMLREKKGEKYYRQLKETLTRHIALLSAQEANQLYTFAFNYCIRQIGKGDDQYRRELFELYQQSLENGALLDNDRLSEWDYKNITTLGCALQEFEWTQQFLENYKEKLPEVSRENAYTFNLARFYYSQKLYDETLSLLLRVQFTEVHYHLNATDLLIRSYYELQNYEALLSLLETFRIYVMRTKKMTTDKKKGWNNYIRFSKKLASLQSNQVAYTRLTFAEKLKEQREKMETTNNVVNKHWLLEKCVPA